MNTQFSAAQSPALSMQGLTPEQVQAIQALIEQTRLQNQSAAVETERKEKRHCNQKSPAKGAFPAAPEEPSDYEAAFEKARKLQSRELKKLGLSAEELEKKDTEFCRNYGAEVVLWSTEDQQELERIWAEEIKWLVADLTPPPDHAPTGVHLRWSQLNEDRLRVSAKSPGANWSWCQEGPQQQVITIRNEADQENYNISHDVNDDGQIGESTPERRNRLKAVKNGEKLTGWALHDHRVEEQEIADDGVGSPGSAEKVSEIMWRRRVQKNIDQQAAQDLVLEEDIARVEKAAGKMPGTKKPGTKKPRTKKLRTKKTVQDEEVEEFVTTLLCEQVAQTLFSDSK